MNKQKQSTKRKVEDVYPVVAELEEEKKQKKKSGQGEEDTRMVKLPKQPAIRRVKFRLTPVRRRPR